MKLFTGNVVFALNSRVVLVILCRTGVVSWQKDKLEAIDGLSWKLLTMYGVFDCKGVAGWLYFPWKTGAKGLVSVGDCVNIEITNI